MEDIRVRVWSEQNATSVHSFSFVSCIWEASCANMKMMNSFSLLVQFIEGLDLICAKFIIKALQDVWAEEKVTSMAFESGLNARTMASTLSPGLGRKPKKVLETPRIRQSWWHLLARLHFLYREQFASSPLVDSGVEVTEKSVSWNRAQGRWPGWWKVSGWSWWDVHLWCSQSHWEAQVGDKLIVFQLEQKFYFGLSELQHLMKPSQEHVFKGMWTRGDAWTMIYESLIGLRKVI